MKHVTWLAMFFGVLLNSAAVHAQQQSAEALQAAQREQLMPLKMMDGIWRGTAWTILPSGKKVEMIQTERVGSMLDGAVKVIEGKGYDSEGAVVFNAFASIAYDATKKELMMRSYAQGRVGDFAVKPNEKGFSWEIPAGPATIRYVAEIADGKWLEYGERVVPNRDPVRFFEMTLSRVGDTEWPASDSVPMEDKTDGRSKQ